MGSFVSESHREMDFDENESYVILMVSQSILFCIHITPIIYTFLWRSASIKYHNQETEKKPDNGLIFLFYMLTYFVIIIEAGIIIYSIIDLISSFSYIRTYYLCLQNYF